MTSRVARRDGMDLCTVCDLDGGAMAPIRTTYFSDNDDGHAMQVFATWIVRCSSAAAVQSSWWFKTVIQWQWLTAYVFGRSKGGDYSPNLRIKKAVF